MIAKKVLDKYTIWINWDAIKVIKYNIPERYRDNFTGERGKIFDRYVVRRLLWSSYVNSFSDGW